MKKVFIKPHTRADGTTVAGHYRDVKDGAQAVDPAVVSAIPGAVPDNMLSDAEYNQTYDAWSDVVEQFPDSDVVSYRNSATGEVVEPEDVPETVAGDGQDVDMAVNMGGLYNYTDDRSLALANHRAVFGTDAAKYPLDMDGQVSLPSQELDSWRGHVGKFSEALGAGDDVVDHSVLLDVRREMIDNELGDGFRSEFIAAGMNHYEDDFETQAFMSRSEYEQALADEYENTCERIAGEDWVDMLDDTGTVVIDDSSFDFP